MTTYFYICVALFALGVALLVLGSALKDRLPPRFAAALIIVGVALAMIFMNITLVMQLMIMNG